MFGLFIWHPKPAVWTGAVWTGAAVIYRDKNTVEIVEAGTD